MAHPAQRASKAPPDQPAPRERHPLFPALPAPWVLQVRRAPQARKALLAPIRPFPVPKAPLAPQVQPAPRERHPPYPALPVP